MAISILLNEPKIELGSIIDSSFQESLRLDYKLSKIVILVDENTHENCLEYMLTQFEELTDSEIMLLPAGEENKVLEVCFQVWEALSEYKISRHDLIINLGGGIVTDMGGFIASVYKRGIPYIQIPTSLLAMVDAAIGGKTGIDLGHFKNQLGVFSNPKAIYIDPIFLATLPVEEIQNGLAEMLKHALISSQLHWNELTDSNFELNELILRKSIQIKLDIVSVDPFEKDERKKLNFGHTIGHAIEGLFLNTVNQLHHGHAVALGILCESYLSHKKKLLSENEFNEIVQQILLHFDIPTIEDSEFDTLFELMQQDKKNRDGKIFAVLLTQIGACIIDQELNKQEIVEALYWLNSLKK